MNKPKNITKNITLYYFYVLILTVILIFIYTIQFTNLIQANHDYCIGSNYITSIFSINILNTVSNLFLDYTILHLVGFLLCLLINIVLY